MVWQVALLSKGHEPAWWNFWWQSGQRSPLYRVMHVMSVPQSLQDSGMISYLPSHGVDPVSSIIASLLHSFEGLSWHPARFLEPFAPAWCVSE